jgi:hypothetical protein
MCCLSWDACRCRVIGKHGVTREELDLKQAVAGIEFVLWWFRFAFHLFSFLHCDCSVLVLVVYDTDTSDRIMEESVHAYSVDVFRLFCSVLFVNFSIGATQRCTRLQSIIPTLSDVSTSNYRTGQHHSLGLPFALTSMLFTDRIFIRCQMCDQSRPAFSWLADHRHCCHHTLFSSFRNDGTQQAVPRFPGPVLTIPRDLLVLLLYLIKNGN